MADFVEWGSGQGGVHGRPHPDVVEEVPRSPTLPVHANPGMVGMEDLVQPTEVPHCNVPFNVAPSSTVHIHCPKDPPYNCLMREDGPCRWYAVAIGLHIGISSTAIEANRLVKRVVGNKHRKFKTSIAAEYWL